MHMTNFRSDLKQFAGQNAWRSLSGDLLGGCCWWIDGAHRVGGRSSLTDPSGLGSPVSANSMHSDQSAAPLRMFFREARRAVEHSAIGYELGDTKAERTVSNRPPAPGAHLKEARLCILPGATLGQASICQCWGRRWGRAWGHPQRVEPHQGM